MTLVSGENHVTHAWLDCLWLFADGGFSMDHDDETDVDRLLESSDPKVRGAVELLQILTNAQIASLVGSYVSQLSAQAETIASLQSRLDALTTHLHSERRLLESRFEAERDGWDRSAEALLRRTRTTPTPTPVNLLSNSDSHASHRLQSLEAQVTALRPSILFRKRKHSPPPPPSASTPAFSDARIDHILLAARTLGRDRALENVSPPSPPKKEKGKSRAAPSTPKGGVGAPHYRQATTPTTPRRIGGGVNPYLHVLTSPSPYPAASSSTTPLDRLVDVALSPPKRRRSSRSALDVLADQAASRPPAPRRITRANPEMVNTDQQPDGMEDADGSEDIEENG